MPQRFPGMNPYLENPDVWHDFHQGFMSVMRSHLTPQIRPVFFAKIDENVYIHELSAKERSLLGRPDVGVFQSGSSGSTATIESSAVPLLRGFLQPQVDRLVEPFIEIRDRESRELVTVIELLSPTNKNAGPDRQQYVAKRSVLLASSVNFVEVDLLRGGEGMPVSGWIQCDYGIMVSRYVERPQVDLWPVMLRQRLPKIPVPLTTAYPDATLDLQDVLNEQIESAGYEDYIYNRVPKPPLSSEDANWARIVMN